MYIYTTMYNIYIYINIYSRVFLEELSPNQKYFTSVVAALWKVVSYSRLGSRCHIEVNYLNNTVSCRAQQNKGNTVYTYTAYNIYIYICI